MKKVLILTPIFILCEFLGFSWVVELLRQPSDVAVLFGVILSSIIIICNIFLFKFINKQIKL